MNLQRRDVLRAGSGLGVYAVLVAAGMIQPGLARAAGRKNQGAFDARTLNDALAALGADEPANSADLRITAPDIAENGALVSIGVMSDIAGTESIAILVEKNPAKLAAIFGIPAGTLADVQTRIKMGQTSDVYALVKAEGKFYMTKREVRVTVGGCGN